MSRQIHAQQTHKVKVPLHQPSPIEATGTLLLTEMDEHQERSFQTAIQQRSLEYSSSHVEATALLGLEKVAWPNSPKAIRSPLWMILWDVLFDLALFSCAVAFLAFAVVVNLYDQASTRENARTTNMLLDAIKYVGNLIDPFVSVNWIDTGPNGVSNTIRPNS
jgi:hypothetical protein